MKIWTTFLLAGVLIANESVAQDSLGIRKVGSIYNWWEGSQGIAIRGNYLFANTGLSGFQSVDISDPSNPRDAGLLLEQHAANVIFEGDRAYLGVRYSYDTIKIVDISDPDNIRLLAEYGNINRDAANFTVDNGFLYMPDLWVEGREHGSALKIVDLRNPNRPVERGSTRGINCDNMTIRDGLLYCSDINKFTVWDVSIPNQLHRLGQGEEEIYSLTIAGQNAYAGCRDSTLLIYDITDPTNLTVISTLRMRTHYFNTKFGNGRLYLYQSGLSIIDVQDPENPTETNHIDRPEIGSPLTISDNLLITSRKDQEGISFWDISDPDNPSYLGSRISLGGIHDVIVYGDYAYASSYRGGLSIINVSDPASPVEMSFLPLPTVGQHVSQNAALAKAGSVIYFSHSYDGAYWRSNGYMTIDVSDVANPRIVSEDTTDKVADFKVYGNRAYVSLEDSGLSILDVSIPTTPRLIGGFRGLAKAGRVVVVDEIAYLLDYRSYVGPDSSYLIALDVSDPSEPEELSRLNIGDFWDPCKMATDGSCIYLTNRGYLWQISLSDPAHPSVVRKIGAGGTSSLGVRVSGEGCVIVANSSSGFSIFKNRDNLGREIPLERVMRYDTPGCARNIFVRDNLLYVADQTSLGIYDIANITGWEGVAPHHEPLPIETTITAYPNPFNGQICLRYSVDEPGFVSIVLLDLTGRQLARLDNGFKLPGSYSVNRELGQIPSGKYFAGVSRGRLESIIPITCVK